MQDPISHTCSIEKIEFIKIILVSMACYKLSPISSSYWRVGWINTFLSRFNGTVDRHIGESVSDFSLYAILLNLYIAPMCVTIKHSV